MDEREAEAEKTGTDKVKKMMMMREKKRKIGEVIRNDGEKKGVLDVVAKEENHAAVGAREKVVEVVEGTDLWS